MPHSSGQSQLPFSPINGLVGQLAAHRPQSALPVSPDVYGSVDGLPGTDDWFARSARGPPAASCPTVLFQILSKRPFETAKKYAVINLRLAILWRNLVAMPRLDQDVNAYDFASCFETGPGPLHGRLIPLISRLMQLVNK